MNWRQNIDSFYAMRAKVIRDKKDREIIPIETTVENMGHFTDGINNIHSIQAQDRFRDFKPVYFSLCNPYKAFGKLGLTVIEHFEGISEKAVYAVKNEGKWQVLELIITKEQIKIQRVL